MNHHFINEYAHIRQVEMRRAVEAARTSGNSWERDRWRSRLARRLVNAAFAVESEASWREVWEKMSNPPDEPKGSKKPGVGERRFAR